VNAANLAVSADTDPSGRMAFLSRRFLGRKETGTWNRKERDSSPLPSG